MEEGKGVSRKKSSFIKVKGRCKRGNLPRSGAVTVLFCQSVGGGRHLERPEEEEKTKIPRGGSKVSYGMANTLWVLRVLERRRIRAQTDKEREASRGP